MNRRVEFLLGGFAILVVLALIALGRTSDASRVMSVVDEQSAMWNAGNIDGLYATMTADARQI